MSSTNFIVPNTSVSKRTHTLSLLNFAELNTSVLNAHIRVYLNLTRRVARGGNGGNCPPNWKRCAKIFLVTEAFDI